MTKLGVVAAIVLCFVGIAVLGSSGVAGLLLLALSAAIATVLVVRA
jgi:hypothetical protein